MKLLNLKTQNKDVTRLDDTTILQTKIHTKAPTLYKKSIKITQYQTKISSVKSIKTNKKFSNLTHKFYDKNEFINQQEIIQGEPIYLNVYNVTGLNLVLNIIGVGIYHTNIQVYKTEYCFGYTFPKKISGIGISDSDNSGFTLRGKLALIKEKVLIGFTLLSKDAIEEEFVLLSYYWESASYNPFKKNCNDFSYYLAKRLSKKVEFPSYINRFSYVWKIFDCFYEPVKSMFDKKVMRKKEKLQSDIQKDNSNYSLITKIPNSTILNKLTSQVNISEVNNFEADLILVKSNFESVSSLELVDPKHFDDQYHNLETVILETKALSKSTSADTSTAIIDHIKLVVRRLFISFDLLMDMANEYFTLNFHNKSLVLINLIEEIIRVLSHFIFSNSHLLTSILFSFQNFLKHINSKISEIKLKFCDVSNLEDLQLFSRKYIRTKESKLLKLKSNIDKTIN